LLSDWNVVTDLSKTPQYLYENPTNSIRVGYSMWTKKHREANGYIFATFVANTPETV
jgi:hypothetical protein